MTEPKQGSKRKRKRLTARGKKMQEAISRPAKKAEDVFVRRFYTTLDEAYAAMCEYRKITDCRPRKLYQCDVKRTGETIWLISNGNLEVQYQLQRFYLEATVTTQKGPLNFGDPRPRLRLQINTLTIELSGQRAMLERMKQNIPSESNPQFDKFCDVLTVEVGIKEIILAEKRALLDHLKSVPRSERYYEYRAARDRIRSKILNFKARAITERPALTQQDFPVTEDETPGEDYGDDGADQTVRPTAATPEGNDPR